MQAGANWQTGNAVFGIEADVQGTSQSASSSMTVVDATGALVAAGANVTAAGTDKITSFGTVSGRLGVASGRSLFYATGGWAYWTWSSTLTVTGLGTASLSNFQGGGAIGGGVELAIANAWTVAPNTSSCSPPPFLTPLSPRGPMLSSTAGFETMCFASA